MIKQKQLPRADQLLFIVGSIALTFVAIFIANGFLKGHTEPIFIEGIL